MAHNFTGTSNGLSFLDKPIGTEQHNTNLASFQVQAHALDTRCEPKRTQANLNQYTYEYGWKKNNLLDQFFGLNIGQTVDSGNTITDCEYPV